MINAIGGTVVILGTGATCGSGYTRNGNRLPGDRGFFGNPGVGVLMGHRHAALDMMLNSFRRLYGAEDLESVGLEEVWTFLEFAGNGLFRDAVDLTEERALWLQAIRKDETRTEDEHCQPRKWREDRTQPSAAEMNLLLVAGWDLRRLLSRVYGQLSPPENDNRYEALLRKYEITKDATTTFISLNYDTVLEDALHRASISWHYRYVSTESKREPAGVRILKPHGSLNWRFRGNEPRVQISTDYSLEPVACRSYEINQFEEALIVPPTQIKQTITVAETQVPEITGLFTSIWQDMMETLATASRVFVIGYSFPPTDLHLRTLLHLALRKREFRPFDEVVCCTKADGQEGAVFSNAARFLPARSFRLRDQGFQALVGSI